MRAAIMKKRYGGFSKAMCAKQRINRRKDEDLKEWIMGFAQMCECFGVGLLILIMAVMLCG